MRGTNNKILVDKDDLEYLIGMAYGYIDDELGGMDEDGENQVKLKNIMIKYMEEN